MSPSEARRRLLKAIAEHEKEGSANFAEDRVLAEKLGIDLPNVQRQLDILEHDEMIRLAKSMGPKYGALLAPAGWKALEGDEAGPSQGTIFISCGQFSDEERSLGKQVAQLVADLTSFEPYFAEDQGDVQGLTEHIFRALHRSEGLIAIMHHRGSVKRPFGEEFVRASVWIEQEIAIAAFMRQVLDKQIRVQAYAQKGIALEGVREKLILNARPFVANEEVLQDLRRVLPDWNPAKRTPKLEFALSAEKKNRYPEATLFRLSASVRNASEEVISSPLGVEILFPARFIGPATHSREVRDRATDSHRLFRATIADKALYPGDGLPILSVDYVIEDLSYESDPALGLPVTARLFRDGKLAETVEKPVREITPPFG